MAKHILEQIVLDKLQDLPGLKSSWPIDKRQRKRRRLQPDQLLERLQQGRIIAEIKRSSPSMGQIDMNVDFVQQARDYEAAGVGMISVLTDERHFSGSFAFLQQIGEVVDSPLLCKDFIVDEWQIDAAEMAGADAILLIVSCFGEEAAKDSTGNMERLRQLNRYALDKGLLPLVEIYAPDERYDAYQLQPYLLGVNSRNLKSMQIDLAQGARTLALLRRELSMPQARNVRALAALPDFPLFVGESGISEIEDARCWAESGADCLLIGTSLMLAVKDSGTAGQGRNSARILQQRIADFRSVFAAGF